MPFFTNVIIAILICIVKERHTITRNNVFLEGVEVYRCNECGEEAARIPAIIELNDLIGKKIIKKNIPLNGAEIKYLRKNMGFTGKALSETMHLDNATISRWESGKQSISESHDILLRLVYCGMKDIPAKEHIENDFKNSFVEKETFPLTIPSEEIENIRRSQA